MKLIDIKIRIIYVFTSFWICFFSSEVFAAELNPPMGTFPSDDLKIAMLFRNIESDIFIPNEIQFNGHGKIKIHPFPDKEISIYIRVKQDSNNPREGGVLIKHRRIYNSRVSRDRRNKVKIIIGKGYYENRIKLAKEKEIIVDLQQYIDYTFSIKVDGIRKFLSPSVDINGTQLLKSEDFHEVLEHLSDGAPNRSLLTTHFIHYVAAKGVRWHRIDIPIAQEEKENLEKVNIEAVLLSNNDIESIGEYTIEQK